MGNTSKSMATATVQERREIAQDHAINQYLQEDRAIQQMHPKILLLGLDEAGKTTLFNQGKLLLGAANSSITTADDLMYVKRVITQNVIHAMRQLIANTPYSTDASAESIAYFAEAKLPEFVDEEMAKHVQLLWGTGFVRKSFEERRRLGLRVQENCRYFLDSIERISKKDYEPTSQDIMYSRKQSTRVTEILLSSFNRPAIVLIDTAGQNTEMRKWLHSFSQCMAILFVAAISEFDESVPGDPDSNRLQESLDLFDQICSFPYFRYKHIILFLNKRDLLQEKLAAGVDPRKVCPSLFQDLISSSFEDVVQHIGNLFTRKNNCPDRTIYTYASCATDQSNVDRVFSFVLDIVVTTKMGLIHDEQSKKILKKHLGVSILGDF